MNNLIYKLERKFGRYSIRNLMLYIIIGMGIVFAFDFMSPLIFRGISHPPSIIRFIQFDRDLFLAGQFWRIISFVFEPISNSIFWIIISMYFYWMIGTTLENNWGSFRFNLFYLLGIIGAIISGFITGYATNEFLNTSLFLAFAILFPEMRIMLFFIIPIKVKYLGYISGGFLLLIFLFSSFTVKIAILAAFINLGIFFGDKLADLFKLKTKYRKTQRNFKIHMTQSRYEDEE
ncbi:MAG: rhomboid family intramembrane serine protease [Oscillospiraceae bacterium]|nr:rhomboid family intramembrane serine protease [Oscillospiraceae bacterium]